MTRPELPSRFDPAVVEATWQKVWEEGRYFHAPDRPQGPTFSLILPPPNVTGVLTLGHMLGDTVMDLLVRWHRMRGEATLWLPSIDHAGLSTQVQVRRRLAQQGIRLESLPREEILAHVQRWKEEHEARIRLQLRAPGLSLDWSRWRYTFDPEAVLATKKVFVRLFEEGLIYRGERIVNWDPTLRTAVSDLEVVHREEDAELLYVRYRWADGSPGGVVVATVRPETIFGDVGVAVHSDDERHRASVGRSVRVPLTDRVVPVVADAGVDQEFGNGALKVTPRHDALDYEISRRHPELEMPPPILDTEARLTGEWVPERFRGMSREKGRVATTQALEEAGLLERKERFRHSVGRSERSDAVIEPLLSTQWFVRTTALAPPVIAAVRSGEIRIHPSRWDLTFFRWMEGLEDWCISRQVTWGHPIPVYYCERCHAPTAATEPPERCPKCGEHRLTADPDVLDTWFTSWLWPFASLGWPEPTAALSSYYPTSVLVTGRDIMFFWVARMMMAGYHFTGSRPFSDVYFTGMLRDERGQKMSKHLGNSPDPAEVIRERGADAVRFALLFPNPVDQDGPFGAGTLDGARNFLTKLWNVVRFALGQIPEGMEAPRHAPALPASAPLEHRWILSRWTRTSREVDEALTAFEFTRAATVLYQFVWHDLADRYVELSKEALQGRRGEGEARTAREVLLFVLERSLRSLHPMVPHVTEELWHSIPHEGEVLAVAPWPPTAETREDPEAEAAMGVVLEAIRALRNLKAEQKLPGSELVAAWVRPAGAPARLVLEAQRASILRLARVAELSFLTGEERPPGRAAATVTEVGEFFVPQPPEAEAAEADALRREREKLSLLLEKTRARLADTGFVSRAPPEVVRETEGKARELAERIARLDEHLKRPGPTGAASA
ncbi:MAG: valine--tRNA ligase [Thermoplasmata archaeon]|nr:valine--tRNA ligase [Thermoplasmata archaeon]